jgi:hypothetical protein
MSKKEQLHSEINQYFIDNNYSFEKDFDLSIITAKNQSLQYICKCGTFKTKAFKEILSRECRNCKTKLFKQIPKDCLIIQNLLQSEEECVPVVGGFITNKGRAFNILGKELTIDEKGRYHLGGEQQYASILMAKAFKIKDLDKLNGQKSNFIVRNISNNEVPELKDIYVGTRNEVGNENGKKSRSSESFIEKMNIDLIEHIEKYNYKKIEELPNHLIFEDGNIYNNKKESGGKRFITGSKTSSNNLNVNQYLRLCLKDKTYLIHRLICMAFNPIEGKTNYDDYEGIEVDHKDGNTLNNHKDNLEWVSKSTNMLRAYETGLNKKVRGVLQYENKNGELGELINEFKSLALASRKTNIAEHEIRELCRGKGNKNNKHFLWKYKNEEDNEEWTKKFSNRN